MAKGITHILKDVILPLNTSSDKTGGKTNANLLFSQPLTNGQAETALNHISGQFVTGQTSASKPANPENSTEDNTEKTVTDFLREIQSSQPFDEAALSKKSVSVELKLSKPPEKLSVADYDAATWKAIFNKAGYSLLTDEELGMAVQAMKNTGYKPSEKGFTLSNLQKFDALPGPMFVKTDQATIERAKRAGQAVLQYQAYKAGKVDKAIQAGKDYVNDAFGGFVQPVVNVVPNLYNGITEPFRAGEKLTFGTNYIPSMPRMEIAERSVYWNKDGRMLANKGAEITATIYFGGVAGSRMLLTQTGRILTGAEAGYNIGAGIAGKDVTQTDTNGNYRLMPWYERGLRITGGIFGARQTVNTELAAPNSAVNKLDDIFDSKPPIKPQTEMVTPDGFKVKVNDNTFDKPFQTADDLILEARKKINSDYAGKKFPLQDYCKKMAARNPNKAEFYNKIAEKYPNGVKFTSDGFPDFSPYTIKTVKLKGLTGKDSDFTLANKAAGFKETPEGYTWHHHQDMETMQLVPFDLHYVVKHTGGASKLKNSNAW